MWSLENLKRMDSYDFELIVGDLFEAMGYATHITPRSHDFGVDILIKLEHYGLSHSWIVQAKKYNGNVGVRDIREYASLRMRDRVDGVIIVTTGHFTEEAVDEAYHYNLKLINGDLLIGMLNRYLNKPMPEKDEKAHEAGDLLLHENEVILIRKNVTINGKRYELVLSNRNIFLKEKGFLSKKSALKHKISISKVLGAKKEKNGILLFIGGENIRTCFVTGDEKILEFLNQTRSLLGQSEKLIKYYQSGNRKIFLTSKRLLLNENRNIWEVPLFRINGVKLKSGWITANSKLVLYIAGEGIGQKELIVDDALSWKLEIESAVRSSPVS